MKPVIKHSSQADTYILTNTRLAFGKGIFDAESFKGGAEKFSCKFLIDPTTDHGASQVKELEAIIKKMVKRDLKLAKLPAGKSCLCDGDEKTWDGFPGNMFVNASNDTRPQVTTSKRVPVSKTDIEEVPYSGCYCHAVIRLWAQDNEYGKRINASLEGVIFYKDGSRFGSGGTTADLSEIPDLFDEDEDDLD